MHPLAHVFLQPANSCHRQYEALRALCVEELSLNEAAQRFGYSPGSLRNLLADLRHNPRRPFFLPPRQSTSRRSSDHPRQRLRQRILALRSQNLSAYQIRDRLRQEDLSASVSYISQVLRSAGLPRLPRRTRRQIQESVKPLPAPLASVHALDLSPRSFRTDFGGLFLFLPFLVQLRFDSLVQRCGMPGSQTIPSLCATLSVLALKLWGIGRPSRISPDTLDEGLGFFAGLNAIPKRSTLGEFSSRVDPRLLPSWTDAWLEAVRHLDLPAGSSFDLDFHTVPHHGRKQFLEKHYVSKRSRSQRGVLTFLVRDAQQDTFCFIDAALQKKDQNEAVLRFVDSYRKRTGQLPGELVFDSRLTTYAVLARLQELGIDFLTLRRRSTKMVRKLLARDGWKRLTLHNIGRRYRHPRVLDQKVRLRGYPAPVRQLAIIDLGHERPTLLLTNQLRAKAADLIDRYARRMVIENAIAESIDFFHLDALCSEVPLKIDADLQFTMMAGTLYRLLARRIGRGHEKQRARQLFERFVRTSAKIRIGTEEIEVRLGRRAHNPLLIAAGLREERPVIPWLGGKRLRLLIGLEDSKPSPSNP